MATFYNQVRLATTQNLTLTTPLSIGNTLIDGKIVYENDRILVKAQTNKVENGIYYVASTGILTRATDFAAASTQAGGTALFVQEGNTFADTGWVISSDGNIIVGSTDIQFERFSVNLKIQGADIPSSIILRSVKGFPLTISELDNNVKYLAVTLTQKLNIVDFTPLAITERITSLTADVADLDSWKLRGYYPTTAVTVVNEVTQDKSTIALRDEDGSLTAVEFIGDLVGNADTASLATYASLANNVDGVIAIANGGTGAISAAGARANLGAVNIAGDTLTGRLILVDSTTTRSSLRIPGGVAPTSPVAGDLWSDSNALKLFIAGNTKTLATLESPAFTGAPTAPTASNASDSQAIATTEFVQNIRELINADIALKSNINSPTFTGTPAAPTPATADETTKLATTAYVKNKIVNILSAYYTASGTDTAIANALTNYYTKAQTDGLLTSNFVNYYTKTQVDTFFTGYYTKSSTDNLISNAVSGKANTSYVDGLQDKWGTSRKFVQTATPTGAVNGDFWFKI